MVEAVAACILSSAAWVLGQPALPRSLTVCLCACLLLAITATYLPQESMRKSGALPPAREGRDPAEDFWHVLRK